MTISPRFALAAIAAPLTLALVACNGDDAATADQVEAGDPIADIAPPDGQAWTEVVNVSEFDGYVLGNPDAPIKVVEYASHTCPACAAFAQNGATPLKEEYVSTGVVSYELRNYVFNIFDLTIAALARCGADESFHPLADQAWQNFGQVQQGIQQGQQRIAQMGDVPDAQRFVVIADATGLLDFFAARGISRDQAATCLSDVDAVMAIGERSDQQTEELGVTGTPTFFVNGARVDGISWADVEPVLQRAGARDE